MVFVFHTNENRKKIDRKLDVGQKAAEQNRTQEPGEPRQYAKQKTYKWTMRLITAVRKAMARRANNHMFRLNIRDNQNNHLNLTNDEIFNYEYL